MVGLVKWGEAQGGYFGVTEGDFAFQHAEVNLFWQALGIVVAIGLGVVTAAVMAFILERTIGLRLSEEEQVAGIDGPVWGLDSDLAMYTGGNGAPSTPAPASGAPTPVPAAPSDSEGREWPGRAASTAWPGHRTLGRVACNAVGN